MTTDPLPTSTALTIGFGPEEMADVKAQAAAHNLEPADWIKALVRRALATERVERSDGTEMAATRADEAVARRRRP